jgi:hypothetical protein
MYETAGVMDAEACTKWILAINGELRGGEWKALQNFGGTLCVEQFTHIYIQNLTNGLWWSLASDLEKHKLPLPSSSAPLHQEALDHIFIRRLTCNGILTLPSDIKNGLPNSKHPSDHLPIGGVFTV